MNPDNHPATGEQDTGRKVAEEIDALLGRIDGRENLIQAMSDLINAALATEREYVREKCQPLVEIFARVRDKIKAAHGLPNFHSTEIKDIDAALAQVKEGK